MDSGRPYHHGGGGRHRSSRGHGRGGYRGDRRHRHHQPYRSPGGGRGGGGGGRGNRFGGQPQLDPETALLRKISSFVSRVGEFQNLRASEREDLRSIEFTTASNINDLVPILCAPDKLEILFKYNPEASKDEEKVGKIVHLIVSCVADLPMQTPAYAALTLAVHEHVKTNEVYAGFVTRCLQYTMLQIAREIDTTLLSANEKVAQSTCRLKLLLRYLCMLAKAGIVKAYEGEAAVEPSQMTVFGLIFVLVKAATAATNQHQNLKASAWLCLVILSTVPYIIELQGVPRDAIDDKIVKPVEQVLSQYKSTFTPGIGMTALLLKEPQVEEGDEPDEEGDDDADGDADEDSEAICDTLQDLLRAVKCWRKEDQSSRFLLPMDAPWKGLLHKNVPNPGSGEESEIHPVEYTEEPVHLRFPRECQLLNLLLTGGGADSPLKLQYFNLEGAVFGRLPIFGSPPDPDDDEEDEEEMEGGATKNEQLQAFRSMSLLDRYFVSETLRDSLICHESYVNPSGLELGNAKSVAEEVLRIGHVFQSGEEDQSKGMEFAILETLFGLLAQSTEHSSLRRIFLCRVVLELVRLEPTRISQGLMIGVTNLFQDYLPALVPLARENFSRWFAFHLTNTDYQWPSAYWQLWEPYATSNRRSSRGEFVRSALQSMSENMSDPTPVVKNSFVGVAKGLAKEVIGRNAIPPTESQTLWLDSEIQRRLWETEEDAATLLDYLQSEEVSSALGASGFQWARSQSLVRTLLYPAGKMKEATTSALEKATEPADDQGKDADAGGGDDDRMDEDTGFAKDIYVEIMNALEKNAAVLTGCLKKDAEGLGHDEDRMVQGGATILRLAESIASFRPDLLECVTLFLFRNQIIDARSIFIWILRDVGDSVVAPVLPTWSKFAFAAVHETVFSAIGELTAGGIMTIDKGASSDVDENVTKVMTKVGQLVVYALKRVCSILATQETDQGKMLPAHVDLVEGTKNLVYSSKSLLQMTLTKPVGLGRPILPVEFEELFSKSDMSGTSLTLACGGDQSSPALRLLKRSLERF